MSINSRCGRTDAAVRAGIAARLAEIQARADNSDNGPWYAENRNWDEPYESTTVYCVFHNGDTMDRDLVAEVAYDNAEFIARARTDVPALVNAVESVLDYVARCEESGITMQPGDVRRLIAAALGGAS